MGPYETAIAKISDKLEGYDWSGLTDEVIMSCTIDELIKSIHLLYDILKDINDIIDNIGGV